MSAYGEGILERTSKSDELQLQTEGAPVISALIINADDWGRNIATTDRIYDCIALRTVSSASAMMFMEDSERAAAIAREGNVDAGLHLNFTTLFTASNCPGQLAEQQRKTAVYLKARRINQAIFHPGLTKSFEYVVRAQIEEYCRLYGSQPKRLDGHHHMHLSANVLVAGLLPKGTIVRRNFSFGPGEKGLVNRLYRKAIDNRLAKRHRLTDYFFSLPPLEPESRLDSILSFARRSVTEVETHPVNEDEYRFLTGEGVTRWAGQMPIARQFDVLRQKIAVA